MEYYLLKTDAFITGETRIFLAVAFVLFSFNAFFMWRSSHMIWPEKMVGGYHLKNQLMFRVCMCNSFSSTLAFNFMPFKFFGYYTTSALFGLVVGIVLFLAFNTYQIRAGRKIIEPFVLHLFSHQNYTDDFGGIHHANLAQIKTTWWRNKEMFICANLNSSITLTVSAVPLLTKEGMSAQFNIVYYNDIRLNFVNS